ncbi:LysR family transcriptional regulator, partial [Streptomyces sp. NPDC059506]
AGDPLWQRYLLVWRREAVGAPVVEVLHHHAARAHRDLLARAPHLQRWAARAFTTARPPGEFGTVPPGPG